MPSSLGLCPRPLKSSDGTQAPRVWPPTPVHCPPASASARPLPGPVAPPPGGSVPICRHGPLLLQASAALVTRCSVSAMAPPSRPPGHPPSYPALFFSVASPSFHTLATLITTDRFYVCLFPLWLKFCGGEGFCLLLIMASLTPRWSPGPPQERGVHLSVV